MSTSTENLSPALKTRLEECRRILRELGSVAVAISGGMDSCLLLHLAVDELGADNVLAVTAVSTIFPQRELSSARKAAAGLGVELVEMPTEQLTDPHFTANPADRCYYCKSKLFSAMQELARERHVAAVVSGANASDLSDYRPGSRAEEQLGIRRPLLEAGMTKGDIRAACEALGAGVFVRPSSACLASRVPHGEAITGEKLNRIEQAEDYLLALGFAQVRVRDHDGLARIELPLEHLPAAMRQREAIARQLRALGYRFVTLDLEGFRSGSLNPE